jgi:peptide/nickel transport system permease protein
MKRYLAMRLARIVPVVVLISIVSFALLHFAPGGPAGIMASNPKATELDLARIRANFGLDKPLPVQYLLWSRQVFLRLDFGKSYVTGRPVAEMIRQRIPATLELMGAAFAIALLLAVVMGVVSALRRESLIDQIFSIVSSAGMSVPVFWLGLVAIYVFSLRLGVLPSGGSETIGATGSVGDHLRHLVLPTCVLSIAFFASWSRYLRSRLIDAFGLDFVRTARAKGLSERMVVYKHALANAAVPVLTVVVMQIPTLFTGAVITETVFSWPGMGRLFYDGLERHDYARVLGIVVISSFIIIVFNLIGDLVCMAVDPRISAGMGLEGVGAGRTPKTAADRRDLVG